jgi:hypothetical protein
MRASPLLVFALFFGALALPILLSPLPPLTDYINHLARIHILASQGQESALSRFYGVDWHLVPNLAMDILAPPLARLFGIYTAGKIFLLLSLALVLSGTQALSAQINGRLWIAPVLVTPFIFSSVVTLGLVNYVFGLGVAVWGVALWVRLAEAPAYLRALVSLLFVALTYLGHLAASGVYGLGIAAFELALLTDGTRRSRPELFARAAALIVPFLPIPALFLTTHGASATQSLQFAFELKLEGIRFFLRSYWWPFERVAAAVAAVLMGLAYWAGWWRFSRAALWLLALSLPVYLMLPYRMVGTWAVDIRVPTGLFFVLIGMLRWSFPAPRLESAFVLVVLAFTVARMMGVLIAFQDYDRSAHDLRASLGAIPLGSRVLVARTEMKDDTPVALQYLPCQAVIERESLVSLVFSDPLAQIVVVKEPYRRMAGGYDDDPPPASELMNPPLTSRSAPSGRIYWRNWQQDYDFLYLLGSEDVPALLPKQVELLATGHRFRLYRIPHAPA